MGKVSSWYDVERDHVPPYSWNNLMADNAILIKLNIEECYR
jgi:hypothetical protein